MQDLYVFVEKLKDFVNYWCRVLNTGDVNMKLKEEIGDLKQVKLSIHNEVEYLIIISTMEIFVLINLFLLYRRRNLLRKYLQGSVSEFINYPI